MLLLRKECNTLTATKATRELDIKGPAQPIAESQLSIGSRNGVPSLETAVSVHIEAEEVAITERICIVGM